MNYKKASTISNKIIDISQINIFQNTRDQSHVELRALLSFILRNKLKMRWIDIASFFESKGKNMKHSTVIYLVNTYPNYKLNNDNLAEIESCFSFEKNTQLKDIDKIYKLQKTISKLKDEKHVLSNNVKFLENKIKMDPVLDLFFDIPRDKFNDVIERLNLFKKSWAWKNNDKCHIIEGYMSI